VLIIFKIIPFDNLQEGLDKFQQHADKCR